MEYLVYRTLGRRRVKHREFETLDAALVYCGTLGWTWVDNDFEQWDLEITFRKER